MAFVEGRRAAEDDEHTEVSLPLLLCLLSSTLLELRTDGHSRLDGRLRD